MAVTIVNLQNNICNFYEKKERSVTLIQFNPIDIDNIHIKCHRHCTYTIDI